MNSSSYNVLQQLSPIFLIALRSPFRIPEFPLHAVPNDYLDTGEVMTSQDSPNEFKQDHSTCFVSEAEKGGERTTQEEVLLP